MKDWLWPAGLIFTMEVIDHLFGRAVGLAVAITALISILVFLWHAGEAES